MCSSDLLGEDPRRLQGLLAAMAVGVAAGSWIAGRWSIGTIELGLAPLGSLGWFLASLGLAASSSYWISVVLAGMSGLCAAGFVVPLDAFLQKYSPAEERGSFVATANVFTALGMLGASAAYWLLASIPGVGGPR